MEGGSNGKTNGSLSELCCAQSCRGLICTVGSKTTSAVGGSYWAGQSQLADLNIAENPVTSLMTSPSSSSTNPEGVHPSTSTKSGISRSSVQTLLRRPEDHIN